jgi:hypothetical protein
VTSSGEARQTWKYFDAASAHAELRGMLNKSGTGVATGLADLESYDFVARLKAGAPMNAADRDTFFGGAAKGYTDYPPLREAWVA